MVPQAYLPSGGYVDLKVGAMQGLRPLLQDIGLFCELLGETILPEEMVNALEPTLDLARDVYCPVQTGELRASGYVEARARRGSATAEIGFGRGGIPQYAVMVHENPAAYHEAPTQYKFLERAVYEDSTEIMGRLAEAVKRRARL